MTMTTKTTTRRGRRQHGPAIPEDVSARLKQLHQESDEYAAWQQEHPLDVKYGIGFGWGVHLEECTLANGRPGLRIRSDNTFSRQVG